MFSQFNSSCEAGLDVKQSEMNVHNILKFYRSIMIKCLRYTIKIKNKYMKKGKYCVG